MGQPDYSLLGTHLSQRLPALPTPPLWARRLGSSPVASGLPTAAAPRRRHGFQRAPQRPGRHADHAHKRRRQGRCHGLPDHLPEVGKSPRIPPSPALPFAAAAPRYSGRCLSCASSRLAPADSVTPRVEGCMDHRHRPPPVPCRGGCPTFRGHHAQGKGTHKHFDRRGSTSTPRRPY